MQNEKIAIIALAIIIFGALAVYLGATYGEEILGNLFPEEEKPEGEKIIEIGDCADVNYIGTLNDGSIFDSSYNFPENKTGGTPLNIFISMNQSEIPPTDYSSYSSGLIEGFMEGLIGLKEGETAIIGPIPPEKAYGTKIKNGDIFSTAYLLIGTDINVEVTEYSEEYLKVKWINPEEIGEFTSPQMVILDFDKLQTEVLNAVYVPPPGLIWENATTITNINDDTCEAYITPTLSEQITEEITPVYDQEGADTNLPRYYVLPDATTATWNDTTITLDSSPEIGAEYFLTITYYGMDYTTIYKVVNITEEKIIFSAALDGEEVNESDLMYYEVNKTWTFNRSYIINRYYNIPSMFLYLYQYDIENAGYSINELAGKDLTFEVTIENVYKTSQES